MLKYFENILGHFFRLHVNTCPEEAFLLVYLITLRNQTLTWINVFIIFFWFRNASLCGMKGVCGFFFPQKTLQFQKTLQLKGPFIGMGKGGKSRPRGLFLGGVGRGSNDGSLKGLTRRAVSTQTMEPQLLGLKGASELSHPSFGYRRGNWGHYPGNLLSGGGLAWALPYPCCLGQLFQRRFWTDCSQACKHLRGESLLPFPWTLGDLATCSDLQNAVEGRLRQLQA